MKKFLLILTIVMMIMMLPVTLAANTPEYFSLDYASASVTNANSMVVAYNDYAVSEQSAESPGVNDSEIYQANEPTEPNNIMKSAEVVPIPDILKDTVAQIIVIIIMALLGWIAAMVKKYLNITIHLPGINDKIAEQCRDAETSIVPVNKRNSIITDRLKTTLTPKEKKILSWLHPSINDAVEHIFKTIIKPERIYKSIKMLVK